MIQSWPPWLQWSLFGMGLLAVFAILAGLVYVIWLFRDADGPKEADFDPNQAQSER